MMNCPDQITANFGKASGRFKTSTQRHEDTKENTGKLGMDFMMNFAIQIAADFGKVGRKFKTCNTKKNIGAIRRTFHDGSPCFCTIMKSNCQ